VSAPKWTRGKRQLLYTTGKDPVASCPSYLLLALTFSILLQLASFFVFDLSFILCASYLA
jgi:hypothetical protein